MLDRSERVHGQMLPRPGRTTKPCVVRHVHDQTRATTHEFTDELRENPFVADHHSERGWRTREDARAGARLELGDELGPAPHESNQSRQRHELPERNEANLIIPADDPAFREEKRAVTKLRRSLSLNVDRADQKGRV